MLNFNIMKNLFQFPIITKKICRRCGNEVSKSAESDYLVVGVQPNTTCLSELIPPYFSNTTIDNYLCTKCGNKQNHDMGYHQTTTLENLPNVLVISLQRQHYDVQSKQNIMRDQPIKFDQTINFLKEYVSDKFKVTSCSPNKNSTLRKSILQAEGDF